DPQHRLLGLFVVDLIGDGARLFGALAPMIRIVNGDFRHAPAFPRHRVLLPGATTLAPGRSTRPAPSHRKPCARSPHTVAPNPGSDLPFAAGGRLASRGL